MNGPEPPASIEHLLAIEKKLLNLECRAYDAAEQIGQQIKRESRIWCPCRIVTALAPVGHQRRDYIAKMLKYGDFEHVSDLADPCSCQDLWFSGHLPIDIDLPHRPGVYICFDDWDRAAYIGTSKNNVRGRIRAHHRDPEKPSLARWSAFFPGRFGESAAVWEVRLIEEHQPYLNRQHIDDGGPEVDWQPQGYQSPSEPWHMRDEDYLWYRRGPGRHLLAQVDDIKPWATAKAIRNLLDRGASREILAEATQIALDALLAGRVDPPDGVFAYMCGVARNMTTERL